MARAPQTEGVEGPVEPWRPKESNHATSPGVGKRMMQLYLLDVDGVLVGGTGYLDALVDTVAHFSRAMGVGELPLTEKEVRIFELNGLTSEWDSGAACVAALLLERLRTDPFSLPPDWPAALAALAEHPCPITRPDYGSLANEIGRRLVEDKLVSRAMAAVFSERAHRIEGLRPFLPSM